jgi:hypothetical protein
MLVLVGENRPICRSLTQTKWHFPVSRELEPFTLVMLASATRFRPIFTRLAAVLRRGRLGAGNGHYWTFRFYPSCARASIGRRSDSGSRPAENVAQNVAPRVERRIQTNGRRSGHQRQDGSGAASPQAPAYDRSGPKSHCVNKGVNITGGDSPKLALAPIGRLKALRDYGKS